MHLARRTASALRAVCPGQAISAEVPVHLKQARPAGTTEATVGGTKGSRRARPSHSAQNAQNSCGSHHTGNQCWRAQQQALLRAGSTWTTRRTLQKALKHIVVTH